MTIVDVESITQELLRIRKGLHGVRVKWFVHSAVVREENYAWEEKAGEREFLISGNRSVPPLQSV